MTLADLGFGQTIAVSLLGALFTAAFVGVAAEVVTRKYQDRSAARRAGAKRAHERRLLGRQLEHQTRAALRETYAQLLVAQRKSREASRRLSRATDPAERQQLDDEAGSALDRFMDLYHRLNLDVSRDMWLDARGLRNILEDMLAAARGAEREKCERLARLARDARQNLEIGFRSRLGHAPLQSRRDLGVPYDKRKTAMADPGTVSRVPASG